MMIQESITKAIEGGYEPFLTVCAEDVSLSIVVGELVGEAKMGMPYRRNLSSIFLDPLFWQCYGKAMGWKKKVCDCVGSGISPCYSCEQYGTQVIGKDWKDHWHRFIDHLAEGKDAESFFENLR